MLRTVDKGTLLLLRFVLIVDDVSIWQILYSLSIKRFYYIWLCEVLDDLTIWQI